MPTSDGRITVMDTIREQADRYARFVAVMVRGMNRNNEPLIDDCGHHCGTERDRTTHCACVDCHGKP